MSSKAKAWIALHLCQIYLHSPHQRVWLQINSLITTLLLSSSHEHMQRCTIRSSWPSGSTPHSQDLTNVDKFKTRESYSSLHSHWGVDNSEDDPHPSYNIALSFNSTTTTPKTSPSRNGNRKGKAAICTVPVPNGMMNPLKRVSDFRRGWLSVTQRTVLCCDNPGLWSLCRRVRLNLTCAVHWK